METGFHDRRVAVVGLGALGNELVRLLGLHGAGEVLLVDPDKVEPSNLAKCAWYCAPGSVGRPKAEVLAELARAWFPRTDWQPVAAEIADVGWRRLRGRDLLFCGVDRDSARLEVARIATRLDLPVCDGGMNTTGAAGRVTWYPGRGGACHGCRLSAARRRELLRTWSSAAYPCRVPEEPGGWTTTPALASITAALQVHFGAIWLSRGEPQGRSVEFRLDAPLRFDEILLPLNEACPFHSAPPLRLVPVEGPFRDVLAPGGEACWEWPVCLRARCLDCRFEWSPRMRAVRLRRGGACPRCGSRRLLELDTRSSVCAGDPLAALDPVALGLPAEHLYSIRIGRQREETG